MITQFLFFFSVFFSLITIGAYQFGYTILSVMTPVFFLFASFSFFMPMMGMIVQSTDITPLKPSQKLILFPVGLTMFSIYAYFSTFDPFSLLLFGVGLFVLFCFFEARIAFVFALVFLIDVILSLLVDQKNTAEMLSIAGYFFLVMGVCFSLIQAWIRTWIDRWIPGSMRIPRFIESYITEIYTIARLGIRLIPVFIFSLIILRVLDGGDRIFWDIRFLFSLGVGFLLVHIFPEGREKYDSFLLSLLFFLSTFLLFLIFGFPIWIKILIVGFYVILYFLLFLRREYVKKLVKKYFPL